MVFLEQIKYDFQNADMNFNEIKSLKAQLKSFIQSELKPHYSTKFMRQFSNINFFLWAPDITRPEPHQEQKEICYNDAMEKMMNLIDELLLNINEYKKSEYNSISGDYISGDKVSGDKAGRDINKAFGDITFGDKNTFSSELDNLKNKLNEGVEDKELKEELIHIVDDIHKNQDNKEKRSQLINKLWERGSQFMTILGPFAPILFS